VFIGNTGVGKSALLNQLGGNFKSELSFATGVTKDISEQTVELNGKPVVLMDIPGLGEVSTETNEKNTELLTEALSRGYDYKLVFVLRSSNRIVDAEDMALVSEVNKCLRHANVIGGGQGKQGRGSGDGGRIEESKISFRIIVNNIAGQKLYGLYQRCAADKFHGVFQELHTKGLTFDIHVDDVLLLMADDDAVEERRYKQILADFLVAQKAVPVSVVEKIDVSPELVKKTKSIIRNFRVGAAVVGGTAIVVAGAAALGAVGAVIAGAEAAAGAEVAAIAVSAVNVVALGTRTIIETTRMFQAK